MRSTAPSLQVLSKPITASNDCRVLRSEFVSSILMKEQTKYILLCAEEFLWLLWIQFFGTLLNSSHKNSCYCKEPRPTWPSPLVCSKTKGVSFFSTSSMPNNMCSTKREREKIRFHLALRTKKRKQITIQFNTAKVVSKDNLETSALTTVQLGPFQYF